MGIKSHHQALLSHFLGLIGASFRYLENVGKYSIVCQIDQNLLKVCQYGENIRYSEKCHNPLIHFDWTHGGCHGLHY